MDIEKFESTTFKDRTAKIPVPELKGFFKKDEEVIWEVRGLTAQELAIVNNAVAENSGKEAILEALLSKSNSEKADAVRQALNIIKTSDNVPDDLVRRHATIVAGSVNPVCSEDMAVKLGLNFPTNLYQISQEIYRLTGLGRVGE